MIIINNCEINSFVNIRRISPVFIHILTKFSGILTKFLSILLNYVKIVKGSNIDFISKDKREGCCIDQSEFCG